MRGMESVGTRGGSVLIAASLAVMIGGSAGASAARAAGVTWHGFGSGGFDYNANRPASGTNAYRVFDLNANSFGIDVVELVVHRIADTTSPVGFRVDVAAGSTVPRVTAARGLFRAADGTGADLDLQQAFVTLVAPMGTGLRFDAGKFITPFGSEVIEGYESCNDNATRSLLFGYAIPFTHTGVKATYAWSPAVTSSAMVVNGWDNAVDNNTAKSLGAQVVLTPTATLSVVVGGMAGQERDHDDDTMRQLVDVVVVWKPAARATFGANYDWGRDHRTAPPNTDQLDLDQRWKGGAAYVRLRAARGMAVSLRGEVFRDAQGSRTGVAQTLKELTVTPEYALTPSVLLRADLRRDWSDVASFDKRGVATDSQMTVRGNVVVVF